MMINLILANFELILSFFILIFMELIIGIDNYIYISILSNKAPEKKQPYIRNLGFLLITIVKLLVIGLIFKLLTYDVELFQILDYDFSIRTILLLVSGLVLMVKSISEINRKIEDDLKPIKNPIKESPFYIALQTIIVGVVFSADSVLMSVGLSNNIEVIGLAIFVSGIILFFMSGEVSRLLNKYRTIQIVGLSYLLLIGFLLILESYQVEIPKRFIYYIFLIGVLIELINIRIRKPKSLKKKP